MSHVNNEVSSDQIRQWSIQAVKILTAVFAVVLILGIVLVTFRDNVNQDNSIASFILGFADLVDGPFSRVDGIFSFSGSGAETKAALVNWGLAAVVWVVVGRVVTRLIDR